MPTPEPTTYTAQRSYDELGDQPAVEELMDALRGDLERMAAHDGRELTDNITVEVIRDHDPMLGGQVAVRATATAAPIAAAAKAPWRPKVLVDFDGVIHAYSKGWADGSVYDGPMPGAKPALEVMTHDGYEVVIFSTRDAGQIREALTRWGFPAYRVTNVKEPAVAQIDDRAIRFVDWPQAAHDLRRLYPVRGHGG